MGWNRASCYEFDGKVNGNWDKIRISNGGKAIVEQILASEERQTLKSPKTKTLVEWSIERTSSMLDEIESKTVHKDEEDDK